MFEISTDIDLHPNHAEVLIPKYQTWEDAWCIYNLIKRMHVELDFDLTAASYLGDYYKFGEKRGGPYWQYDTVMRLDKYGPCHLIPAYEERRKIEASEYGLNSEGAAIWSLRTKSPVEITYRD
ncbi:hypothetical protein [Persicirhabdus sediminis]|uniref:Uncharacterized protein n=1 Tax=Persicirhabdus sediminis TaxID=454144 RepID=A0A8J7MHK9_9BACT|nr:hypothetical protein [Persicirhabdus sediminis]MBK1792079.1 hypothetical protein [Persicirhabdus sediminis]